MFRDGTLTASEVVQLALKERGRTQKSLAEELGIGAQTFSKKLVNDTLTAREFLTAIAALGLTIAFQDKVTGDEVKERRRGVIPRVSMVVDKIRYDTFKADALCHTEPFDGGIMELYKDVQGRYYFAISTIGEGSQIAILPCSERHAMRFYEAYKDEENG